MPATRIYAGIDGGASKTDVALVESSGRLVAAVRLPASGHVGAGRAAGLDNVVAGVRAAAGQAGFDPLQPVAEVAVYCLAGIDFRSDERRVAKALAALNLSRQNRVFNDTFAVLRAGTSHAWGVSVTCGSGMNCVGVAPNGRSVRFPALGLISGDLAAGGDWLGVSALGAALRARDGRGARTSLTALVARHFRKPSPQAVVEAIYAGRLARTRTLELPPLVFRAAMEGDTVARALLDKLADEVAAMVTSAIRRLHLTRREVPVVLGGGNFRNDDPAFLCRVERGILSAAPKAQIEILDAPPIVGAVLLALDERRVSDTGAEQAVRSALTYGRMTRARLDLRAALGGA